MSSILVPIELLNRVLEDAWSYASQSCSEYCVHSQDDPKDCPMNSDSLQELEMLIVGSQL